MISSPQRRRESIVESDWKIRELERRVETGEARPARLLAARMRAGQLDPQRIELASALGHPAAKALRPDVEEVNWTSWQARREALRRVTEVVGGPTVVRWAADVAERMLPAWADRYPDDLHAQQAIEATRAWADCPCEKHRQDAADAAIDADIAGDDGPVGAANVGYVAGAGDAAWAASSAADAVTVISHSGRPMSESACSAALTRVAGYAVRVAADPKAEIDWQRLRLAAYVLEIV